MDRHTFLAEQPWATALLDLAAQWTNLAMEQVALLPASGSDRRYVRIVFADGSSLLGVWHPNAKENEAFIRFSEHFAAAGIRVPRVYASRLEDCVYLLEDLGDTTLLDFLDQHRRPDGSPDEQAEHYYQQALAQLAFLQTQAGKSLPESDLLPPTRFDATVMSWDWHYFKYCFLMPSGVAYDEYALERDFNRLATRLAEAPAHFFLFRDFQARNILIHQNEVYFIDYQSGKRGALAYDVASLLLQAKAKLSATVRERLLSYYLKCLSEYIVIDEAAFRQEYAGFSLLRLLQVLGAYGFKGYLQRKPHFIQSIPFALRNLDEWLRTSHLDLELPHLREVLARLVTALQPPAAAVFPPLVVHLQSFSYPKDGIPQGDSRYPFFVFDCRHLPDPADDPAHENSDGRDASVARLLLQNDEVVEFLDHLERLLMGIIRREIRREQSQVYLHFGCVGGQHRSVFVAEYLHQKLQQRLVENPIEWDLKHLRLQ